MASLTLNVAPYFPVGTTLNAYVMPTENPDGAAPTVAASATAVVSASGVVSFAGLADGTRYWVGTGTGAYNYLQASTAPASSISAQLDAKSTADRAYADTVGGNVELQYAQITTSTTMATATVGQDVTGLSITVTVGARPILVQMQAGAVSIDSAGGIGIVGILEGSTVLQSGNLGISAPAGMAVPFALQVRLNPSAGSHTYKINIGSIVAGKVTLGASASSPAFIQAIQL